MSVSTRCPECDGTNGFHALTCEAAHRYPQTITRPPGGAGAGVDMVEDPPHYRTPGVEAIDAIEAALGPACFAAYCVGQVMKYAWRWRRKGSPLGDLRKAQWYIDRAIATVEEGEDK